MVSWWVSTPNAVDSDSEHCYCFDPSPPTSPLRASTTVNFSECQPSGKSFAAFVGLVVRTSFSIFKKTWRHKRLLESPIKRMHGTTEGIHETACIKGRGFPSMDIPYQLFTTSLCTCLTSTNLRGFWTRVTWLSRDVHQSAGLPNSHMQPGAQKFHWVDSRRFSLSR